MLPSKREIIRRWQALVANELAYAITNCAALVGAIRRRHSSVSEFVRAMGNIEGAKILALEGHSRTKGLIAWAQVFSGETNSTDLRTSTGLSSVYYGLRESVVAGAGPVVEQLAFSTCVMGVKCALTIDDVAKLLPEGSESTLRSRANRWAKALMAWNACMSTETDFERFRVFGESDYEGESSWLRAHCAAACFTRLVLVELGQGRLRQSGIEVEFSRLELSKPTAQVKPERVYQMLRAPQAYSALARLRLRLSGSASSHKLGGRDVLSLLEVREFATPPSPGQAQWSDAADRYKSRDWSSPRDWPEWRQILLGLPMRLSSAEVVVAMVIIEGLYLLKHLGSLSGNVCELVDGVVAIVQSLSSAGDSPMPVQGTDRHDSDDHEDGGDGGWCEYGHILTREEWLRCGVGQAFHDWLHVTGDAGAWERYLIPVSDQVVKSKHQAEVAAWGDKEDFEPLDPNECRQELLLDARTAMCLGHPDWCNQLADQFLSLSIEAKNCESAAKAQAKAPNETVK